MNPADYVNLGNTLLAATIFFGAQCACQEYADRKSKKCSVEELEALLPGECQKLGLNPDNYKIVVEDNYIVDGKCTLDDGKWKIHLNRRCLRASKLRHELYHTKADVNHLDSEGRESLGYYLFIAEPRAILYEAFGIEL